MGASARRGRPPERSMHQPKPGQPVCSLCGHSGVVMARNTLEPQCANRTRCQRRRTTSESGIRQFIKRLHGMEPLTRRRWIDALTEEFRRIGTLRPHKR